MIKQFISVRQYFISMIFMALTNNRNNCEMENKSNTIAYKYETQKLDKHERHQINTTLKTFLREGWVGRELLEVYFKLQRGLAMTNLCHFWIV